ncbi:uncharacterized mitochondrial protein AtMg00810-like [Juglans microcarpa x Juglans regia]|uniref:uncharacterized mitochondrial protein AtMg00810-like n=1 Tax=Juglans microcarpa x Juglans regia TaxID=2249226 RepID=UPI001B7EC10C|nr:uncharacterized mitochondrial protein AtMg00810-like [Juglans microcarpa x Juglans regia]
MEEDQTEESMEEGETHEGAGCPMMLQDRKLKGKATTFSGGWNIGEFVGLLVSACMGSLFSDGARLAAREILVWFLNGMMNPQRHYLSTTMAVLDEPTIFVIASEFLNDIQNAFLYGELTDTVFMQYPQGFIDKQYPNYVCKPNKAIYGLKQAPRAWFAQLNAWLTDYSFSASRDDPSLFILNSGDLHMFLLIYVDDMLITSSIHAAIDNLISALARAFPVKDLGQLSYFLGIEIDYLISGIFLSQRKYIKDLLERSNMLNAKPMTSPMAASLKLSQFDGPEFTDSTLFRSIVGGLQYLSITRPDIAFSVNKVCQFMHCAKVSHWSAVKRILRYLKSTINYGMLFKSSSSLTLQAYTDADWAGCPDDRCSTLAFCIFLGKHLISWSSKKQKTVARSSTEAEYKSLVTTAVELIWIQTLLRELGLFLFDATYSLVQ